MYTTPQPFSRLAAKFLTATFLGAALFMQPAPAHAMGGGSSPSPSPSAPSSSSGSSCSSKTTQSSCLNVSSCWWKASSNKCKKKKIKSELNLNDRLYNEGRLLAKTGSYAKAIAVLKRANQSDPHVLNYLGYSYRKSGNLATAIGYYKTALAIDPDFVLAREYLGEGYVKAGRLDLAKLELDQIGKRCGKGCKEYVELAAVISGTDTATW